MPIQPDTRITRRSLLTATAGATAGWLIRPRGVLAAEYDLDGGPASASARQASTYYAPRPASEAKLGINADPTIPELEALKTAGVDYVRMGPGWEVVEDFETGVLSISKKTSEAFDFMAKNDMHPVPVAAYGPPYDDVATLKVAADVPAGSLTIPLTAPPKLKILLDYVVLKLVRAQHKDQYITNPFYSYYGSLIASTEGSTITLGAKTAVALSAGEELKVYRLRYAPIPDLDPNGTSVRAYMRYARFVAEQIVAHGATGYVCLWNEYPWPMDKWPNLYGFYEHKTRPANLVEDKGMAAILLAALQAPHLPPGVNWINGASDKTGLNSIINQFKETSVLTAAKVDGWREGMHCYSARGPEGEAWTVSGDEVTLVNQRADREGDFGWIERFDLRSGFDIRPIATECGAPNVEDPVKQARHHLRRTASLWGMGIVPFPGGAFTAGSPAYLALQNLTALRNSLGSGGDSAMCPSVASVADNEWPIMSVALYGENGAVLLVWQRTWTLEKPSEPGGGWAGIPSPPPATVTLTLGTAENIVSIQNPRTEESLPSELTVLVADDPIAVRVMA